MTKTTHPGLIQREIAGALLRSTRKSRIDTEALARARTAIGETDEARLRWVVQEFARAALEDVSRHELLEMGYGLLALTLPVGWGCLRVPGPLQPRELLALQDEIKAGLGVILDSTDYDTRLLSPRVGWRLPSGEERLVRTSPDDGAENRFTIMALAPDNQTAVLRAVAGLIVTAGHRLRRCANCSTPFVRRGRAEYCRAECSQDARNERKADAKRRRIGRQTKRRSA